MKKSYDEIHYWSEVKLDIISKYASAYSRILTSQKQTSFHHVYVDAFSGSGWQYSKTKGEFVPGSPLSSRELY